MVTRCAGLPFRRAAFWVSYLSSEIPVMRSTADRVEIGRGQGRQALAVQVFETASKGGRVDFAVHSRRGDDESSG